MEDLLTDWQPTWLGLTNSKRFTMDFIRSRFLFFLQNLAINEYALICGKCVFNKGELYVSIV
jgi:hypothetical protein